MFLNPEEDNVVVNKRLYYLSCDLEALLKNEFDLKKIPDLPRELKFAYRKLLGISYRKKKPKKTSRQTVTLDSAPRKKRKNKKHRYCKVCKHQFKLRIAYNQHKKYHKLTKPCFVKLARLQKEALNKYKPFHCLQCNFQTAFNYNLTQHIKTVHKKLKEFTCMVCNKSYSTNTVLRVHMRIHTGVKPYKCEECDAAFKQLNELKKHKRKHTEEYNQLLQMQSSTIIYKCLKCTYSDPEITCAKKHVKIHHKIDEAMMGKHLIKKEDYKTDTKREERTLYCEECPYVTSNINSIRLHQVTHTTVKPYKCSFCDTGFKRSNDKNRHENVKHRKIGLHKCTHCKREFSRIKVLKQHVKLKHTFE